MSVFETLLPWYKREDQDARAQRTNELVVRARTTQKRAALAQERYSQVVQSYESAQERLCR
jgi:hypothetical protein